MVLDALDITEEEAQGLGEIARHDLALARDFARRAQAAEDADEANRLARSYQRAARSYRQTLALKARLRRDLAQAGVAEPQVQAGPPRPRADAAAVARRKGDLSAALLRLAWEEAERPEVEGEAVDPADAREMFCELREGVREIVAEAGLRDDFCDPAVDDQVAALALGLDFAPEAIARWRDLPDPPAAAFGAWAEDPDRRSSA